MLAKVRRREVPAEKAGKDWRLRRVDVDAFIERSRVQPGQLPSAPARIPPRKKGDSQGPPSSPQESSRAFWARNSSSERTP
jgi:hypothetical protein